MSLSRFDLGSVAACFALLSLAAAGGWVLLGPASALPVCVLGFTILVAVVLLAYRRSQEWQERRYTELLRQHKYDYRQIQSLFSLYGVIRPIRPLPIMRGFPISPDIGAPFKPLECGVIDTEKGTVILRKAAARRSVENGR